jgi:hypothetical protein
MLINSYKKIFGSFDSNQYSEVSNLVDSNNIDDVSIDEIVNDCKKKFQTKYSASTYSLLNEAIDYAYDGLRWHMSQSSINNASIKDKAILIEDIFKIREIWEVCAPKKAHKNMSDYLAQAMDVIVNSKRRWLDVKMFIDIAQDYAKLGGIKIPADLLANMKSTWEKKMLDNNNEEYLLSDDFNRKTSSSLYFNY